LHSRVRELTFGPGAKFEIPLGYHVAAFEIEGYDPAMSWSISATGFREDRSLDFSMRHDKTLFLVVFRDEYLANPSPSGTQERKSVLRSAFADVGWECPRILAAMRDTDDLYFDRVSQIRIGSMG
jgi:hypothetical protein